MELTFTELRQKEVINIGDGKRLGRISDLVFTYPKNTVTGLVVPGCHKSGFFKSAPEIFISMACITKIGEDVILVDLRKAQGGGSSDGCLYISSCQTSSEKNDELE